MGNVEGEYWNGHLAAFTAEQWLLPRPVKRRYGLFYRDNCLFPSEKYVNE
jgi:hypothetical protein